MTGRAAISGPYPYLQAAQKLLFVAKAGTPFVPLSAALIQLG